MPSASVCLFLPLFLVATPPLAAQAQLVRDHLDAELAAAEQGRTAGSSTDLPTGSDEPQVRQLYDAFSVLLDRGAGSDRLSAAMTRLYEITVRRSEWPYAWLGLGLVKLRLEELGVGEIRSAHQPAGAGWLSGALAAFERTLRVDPEMSWAAAGVSQVIFRSESEELRRRGYADLRTFSARHVIDARAALSLTRVAAASGKWADAENYLRRYDSTGADPAVGAWELARIRFADGDAVGGTRAYFEAAAGQGSIIMALLRADLALVADSAELAGFDRTAASQRVAWLRDFWSRREVADGRPAGSRLPEHFRRVRYAFTHFAYRGPVPQYDFAQVYRGAPRGLDDRGVIYIRHGEPDERATYIGEAGTYPNESWLYFRPAGNLIVHFAELRTAGFRLLEDVEPILRRGGNLAEFYTSRGALDPQYLLLAGQYEMLDERVRVGVQDPRGINPTVLDRQRIRNRELIRLGTTTDSDPIHLERSWAPIAQIFGTGGTVGGTGGLLVAIALPAPRDLAPLALPGGRAGYVLRVRTTAADDSGRIAVDVDSVIRLQTPRPLAEGEFLNIVLHYPSAPGNQRVRVIVADSLGETGAVRVLSGVPVVDLGGGVLEMSDLILGREGSGVVWRHPSGTLVPLNPLNAWHTSDAVAIAFEVGGLQTGRSYKVRLGIADLGADSTTPPKASVEFENQASSGREFVTQSLGLRTLRPGHYLLTATVTVGDRVLQRARRITIVAPR